MALGLGSCPRALVPPTEWLLLQLPVGDGRADDREETEKDDGEMAKVALLLLLLGVVDSGCPQLLEGRMHDAKAAKWRGKHPCRDSLIPAASG
jgi:hypothetical protein